MMKLFNFSLGDDATTLNIKEVSVTSSICVCVMCVCFYFYFFKKNLKQCVKKNQPKKIMH